MDNAKYIEVSAAVRYWEDARVDGVTDSGGDIPLRNGENWEPVINLETGFVKDWPLGVTAEVHYKVCDEGEYWLQDAQGQRIAKWKGYYVPNAILCPKGNGYGDYIIFNISASSQIENWRQPGIDAEQWEPIEAERATQPAFDILAHLQRQRDFSEKTFGPGLRTKGVCDHIRKELAEVEKDPTDLSEWIDVVILALDGAWRCGGTPQQIIEGIVAKQTKNEGRVWPDWRTADPNKAIEHDRSHDSTQPAQPVIDLGAQSEQAHGWHKVWEVLSEVMPGFHNLSGIGQECAVMAIRKLAASAQDQVAAVRAAIAPTPIQQVPTAWCTDAHFEAWCERHDMRKDRSDHRQMFDDAASLYLTVPATPSPSLAVRDVVESQQKALTVKQIHAIYKKTHAHCYDGAAAGNFLLEYSRKLNP